MAFWLRRVGFRYLMSAMVLVKLDFSMFADSQPRASCNVFYSFSSVFGLELGGLGSSVSVWDSARVYIFALLHAAKVHL